MHLIQTHSTFLHIYSHINYLMKKLKWSTYYIHFLNASGGINKQHILLLLSKTPSHCVGKKRNTDNQLRLFIFMLN